MAWAREKFPGLDAGVVLGVWVSVTWSPVTCEGRDCAARVERVQKWIG